jgi:NAD(P)-dependent dehydrogenase (short-subunit alcohol dehydrogenase family)
MIPNQGGRIINTSSIAGLGGNPPGMKTLAYNTSKGAVITFTQALACEWGSHGIRVNAICPGVFPTKMAAGLLDHLGPEYLTRVPLHRVGDDEDLKGLAVLLASDAGKHITGQWMAVDGGASALAGG